MTPNLLTQTLTPHLSFDMIFVKGGTFRMGADKATDPDAYDDEGPPHDVTVPDFYLGKFPVTQDIWLEIMGENPSFFQGERRPVERISWLDIVEGDPETQMRAFLNILNEKTGHEYRLPTEAEWEFAARGGCHSLSLPPSGGEGRGGVYAGSDKLKEVGWFSDNGHDETKPVGMKAPNELGLFDMSGNVWEWCEDDWHNSYDKAPKDGLPWIDSPERGSRRVNRGGSWEVSSPGCRSAYRTRWLPDYRNNFVGFRLALALH